METPFLWKINLRKPIERVRYQMLDRENFSRLAPRTLLIGVGVGLFWNYLGWWFESGAVREPLLFVILFGAILFGCLHLIGSWLLILFAEAPFVPDQSSALLKANLFLCAEEEPIDILADSLRAARSVQQASEIWLLDLCAVPERRHLAQEYHARYITINRRRNTKAALINAALACSAGDVVAILDGNIAANSSLLKESLPYFADPHLGFLQFGVDIVDSCNEPLVEAVYRANLTLMQTPATSIDSNSATGMAGAHTVVRRTALTSVGGYQPGNAGDLGTSMALHSRGWRSISLPVSLATASLPNNISDLIQYQVRWAKSSFEQFFGILPQIVHRLSWVQWLAYTLRMTRFWVGPIFALHLLSILVVVINGTHYQHQLFEAYLIRLIALIGWEILINQVMLHLPGTSRRRKHLRLVAFFLSYANWPVFTFAFLSAVKAWFWRDKAATPNHAQATTSPWFVSNLLALILIFAITLIILTAQMQAMILLLMFIAVQITLNLYFLNRRVLRPTKALKKSVL